VTVKHICICFSIFSSVVTRCGTHLHCDFNASHLYRQQCMYDILYNITLIAVYPLLLDLGMHLLVV